MSFSMFIRGCWHSILIEKPPIIGSNGIAVRKIIWDTAPGGPLPLPTDQCVLTADVNEWIKENISGKYYWDKNDCSIGFRNKQDLIAFKLRWL